VKKAFFSAVLLKTFLSLFKSHSSGVSVSDVGVVESSEQVLFERIACLGPDCFQLFSKTYIALLILAIFFPINISFSHIWKVNTFTGV